MYRVLAWRKWERGIERLRRRVLSLEPATPEWRDAVAALDAAYSHHPPWPD